MLDHGVHAANIFPLVTLVSFSSIPAASRLFQSILLLVRRNGQATTSCTMHFVCLGSVLPIIMHE